MKNLIQTAIGLAASLCCALPQSYACSRFTYTTTAGHVVTGRSMDWVGGDDIRLCVSARGQKRTGLTKKPLTWNVKYGNVYLVSYKQITNSGVNEKNLAVDALYLPQAQYPSVTAKDKTLSATHMVQYLLDNFKDVDDLVQALEKKPLKVIAEGNLGVISGVPLKIHFMVTDAKGESCVIEYLNGEQKIYRQKGNAAITNDPFEVTQHFRYFFKEKGKFGAPGSSQSPARLAFIYSWLDQYVDKTLPLYQKELLHDNLDTQIVYSALSLARPVSTPLGVEPTWENPNNTSTVWRTVADLKNGRYYIDSALTGGFMWIDLKKVNFTKAREIPMARKFIFGDFTNELK